MPLSLRPQTQALGAALFLLVGQTAWAQAGTVYRCPGQQDLYTNKITADEARERGCRTIEGAPISVIQATRLPHAASASVTGGAASSSRSGESRVDPSAQRQRDADARRILEGELRREDERLATLRREFNNGEPERRGEERNYQQYLDRVVQMRAGVARAEADVAAIKRELAKLAP